MKLYQGKIASGILRTGTVTEMSKLMGMDPHKAAQLSNKLININKRGTINYLLQGLKEVYGNGKSPTVQGIKSRSAEWKVTTNHTEMVKVTEDFSVSNPGVTVVAAGDTFNIVVNNKAFFKRTNVLTNAQQTLFVINEGEFLGDNRFRYLMKFNGRGASDRLNIGSLSAYSELSTAGNSQPESSFEGGFSFSGSHEKHVEYMNKTRYDFTLSAELMNTSGFVYEQMMVNPKGEKEPFYFTLSDAQRRAMQQYEIEQEKANIWLESTMTANGTCRLFDVDTLEPIIRGNGLLHQIDARNKYAIPYITKTFLRSILEKAARNCMKQSGNTFVAYCGRAMYRDVCEVLEGDVKALPLIQSDLFTEKLKTGKVGLIEGNVNQYTYLGNTIIFMDSELFSSEALASYTLADGSRASENQMLLLDFNTYEGRNNIFGITYEGMELVYNEILGVGGANGRSGGTVSSKIHGSSGVLQGYRGTIMQNPYSSFFIYKESARVN